GFLDCLPRIPFPFCGAFAGDGGPATAATLAGPSHVALDGAGNLFIADLGNARVRRVSGPVACGTTATNTTAPSTTTSSTTTTTTSPTTTTISTTTSTTTSSTTTSTTTTSTTTTTAPPPVTGRMT